MYKTLLTITLVFPLINTLSVFSMAPLGARRGVEAPIVQNAKDVIVVTTPRFHTKLKREMELVDQKGRNMGEDRYTYLDFRYGGRVYSAWWKSRTSPAAVDLNAARKYRFLIRLDAYSLKCTIVRIWWGKKIIWSNPNPPTDLKRALQRSSRDSFSS